MSRLLSALRGRLGGILLAGFIAWALSRPILYAAGLMAEEGMVALYALLASLLLFGSSLVPRRFAWLVPLGFAGLLVFFALSLPGSMPSRALWAVQAILSGASPRDVMLVYQDALLPLLLLLSAFYAQLLMEGEPAFSLPLLVTPILMLWFAGVKAHIALYLPAMLCLPLLSGYVTRGEAQQAHMPRKLQGPRILAVALAITLLAFVISPAQPQTQPQAEQMARDLRRAIEDYFFFTQSRNAFSLASLGYQPMGEEGLGGTPRISHAPVMEVETGEKVYLRGTALDLYNGRAWYDTLSHERYSWQSVRFAGLRSDLFNEKLPQSNRLEPKTVKIRMLSPSPSTLFVPQRIRSLQPGGGMVAYFNASTEVFTTRDLAAGDFYSVEYEPYIAGQAGTDTLVNLLSQGGEDQPPKLAEEYYQLPDHITPDGMIAGLARKVAGNEPTPYRKGLALMNHLKRNYGYSLTVPDAPRDWDFVSYFLFHQKDGYCTYFASAMTVLARSLGLPARYVEGFLAKPGADGRARLTGENGHAWTEIYLAGLGWVVFDASPGEGDQREGQQSPPGQEPSPPPPSPTPSAEPSPQTSPESSPETDPQAERTPTPSPPPEPPAETTPKPSEQPEHKDRRPPGATSFPFWWLLLLLLMFLLVWAVREGLPQRREKKLKTAPRAFQLYWSSLLQANHARRLGMNPQETPLDYAGRLARQEQGPNGQQLMNTAQVYSALLYGRKQPHPDAVDLAKTQYLHAYGQLKTLKKAALRLRWGAAYLRDKVANLTARLTAFFRERQGNPAPGPRSRRRGRKK